MHISLTIIQVARQSCSNNWWRQIEAPEKQTQTHTHPHTDAAHSHRRTFKSAPQGLGYCNWPPIPMSTACPQRGYRCRWRRRSRAQTSAPEQHSQSSHKIYALWSTRLSFNIFKAMAKMLKYATHTQRQRVREQCKHTQTRACKHTHARTSTHTQCYNATGRGRQTSAESHEGFIKIKYLPRRVSWARKRERGGRQRAHNTNKVWA